MWSAYWGWAVGAVAVLGAIDGIFGGGERLKSLWRFAFPPRRDNSFVLDYDNLGYRFDSFEKSGKKAFLLGIYFRNQNRFPIFYQIETSDYDLANHQSGSGQKPAAGKVMAGKTEAVDFPPIFMSFPPPGIYEGDAVIRVRYGKKPDRLGNILGIRAHLIFEPGADTQRRFVYAIYPGSDVSLQEASIYGV